MIKPMTEYELLSRLCVERDIHPIKLTNYEMRKNMEKRREIENRIDDLMTKKWGDL